MRERRPDAGNHDQDSSSASSDAATDNRPSLLQRKLMLRRLHRAADQSGVAPGAEQAVERAASSSGAPLPQGVQSKFESSLGADLSQVRVHTGSASEAASSAVGAKAYTVGNDIHFGAGQYQPSDSGGMHLLAHEVAHTQQQAGGASTRQNKLEVSDPGDSSEHEADRAADAMVSGGAFAVSGGPAGGASRKISRVVDQTVGDIGQLKGPANQPRTELGDVNPVATEGLLPFTKEGWNAQEILGKLGQSDTIEGTDSDGNRCVQAAVLASHILGGPANVVSYLGTAILKLIYNGAKMVQGKPVFKTPSPRELAAAQVLQRVQQTILERKTTYGDMSWAQEALHALMMPKEKDNKGTPANKIMDQASNGGAGMDNYTSNQGGGSEGKDFTTLAAFAVEVDALKEGEQLITTQILKYVGVPGQSGHQLLIYRKDGQLWKYDPADSEAKTAQIAKGGGGLEDCFRKDANVTKWICLAGKKLS